MAEGSETYMGLAVPLFGESEIQQQVAATDILTLTGASGQTGDFLVAQNNTGTEVFVVSSSGAVTSAVGLSMTTVAASGVITASGLSSTSTAAAVLVSPTSTGAIAAGAVLANGVLVQGSSKSEINAAFAFQNDATAVGGAVSLLAVHGSKAPTYFMSIGSTVGGVGAEGDNGFFESNLRFNAAPTTAIIYRGFLVQAGSKTIYLLGAPASNVTVA